MSVCQGCGTQLPPKTWNGCDQKWCSGRCRKTTLYGGTCIDCGEPTSGDAGGKAKAPKRCNACRGRWQEAETRSRIVASLHEWTCLFGEPPSAADWNPAHARNHGCAWKADRYESTGRTWPSVWACQKHFGSWRAALEAAGYESRPPGRPSRIAA